MKYMGSKNRIAKHVLPIILKDRRDGQLYIEPFVGGGNMIDKVSGKRLGIDCNKDVINALKLIRDNPNSIPDLITEEDYKRAKSGVFNCELRGFISFAMSFGGKHFGGYRRDKAGQFNCIENMSNQTRMAKNSAIKQSPLLQGVSLICDTYKNLHPTELSIIYCDPPYEGTTKYKKSEEHFNHAEFWLWCEKMALKGHKVYISEYNAPDNFTCVWSKEINSSLTKDTGSKKGIERLFIHKSQA